MPRAVDTGELRQALLRTLTLTGPAAAPELTLTRALGISQPGWLPACAATCSS